MMEDREMIVVRYIDLSEARLALRMAFEYHTALDRFENIRNATRFQSPLTQQISTGLDRLNDYFSARIVSTLEEAREGEEDKDVVKPS